MTYRNRKLLDLANKCHECMSCGKYNTGGILVACHSNQLRDGKGKGLKAQDYRIFFGCAACNELLDNGRQTREQNVAMFEEAHRKTIAWLFESDHIKVI